MLTRPYKGHNIQVTVREQGFEYDGAIYPSLSAVAKTITGSLPATFFSGFARRRSTMKPTRNRSAAPSTRKSTEEGLDQEFN